MNVRVKSHPKRRTAKLLATPVYILATTVRDFYNYLIGNPATAGLLHDSLRRGYAARAAWFAREVPLDKGSPLRMVRDKIGAHLDSKAIGAPSPVWSEVNFSRYVQWTRLCSIEILKLLELDVYAWTLDNLQKDVVRLMQIDGRIVDLYVKDGHAKAILDVTFAKSPKYAISEEVSSLVRLCDRFNGTRI
jgi:hypothetical protein